MAKQQTWAEYTDRSKMSDADKRFYELRESGYKGPIDQDGYENHDHDHVFAEMARQRRIHGA